MITVPERWQQAIDLLDYAYQPIVNIHTGVAVGHEALLRNYREAGFDSIHEVFDNASKEKVLFRVDLALREKAIRKYAERGFYDKATLFFNIDNRLLGMTDYVPGYTESILDRYNLHAGNVCFEISERHDLAGSVDAAVILAQYKKQHYKIAIDNFGTGYCGLRLLYQSDVDFIKIDRTFIKDLDKDSKKKLFVSSIVNIAHILGITVLGEGVETEGELLACGKVGCDLVQGYLIQKPTTDAGKIRLHYDVVEKINRSDKRHKDNDEKLIHSQMATIGPLNETLNIPEVFEAFRTSSGNSFFPVVNANNEPTGIIRESDFKKYLYSPFGKEVLTNKSIGKRLKDFTVRCPVAEINKQVEKILEIFSLEEESDGIIITENGRYIGFLSTRSLLRILNEKNLDFARDQNPLTRLPGNNLIIRYLSEIVNNRATSCDAVYFDFDNFKPFNDRYGFRMGDRAIIMFTEILRKHLPLHEAFIGHIGGDDFFVGFGESEGRKKGVNQKLIEIIDAFSSAAASLYDTEDRRRGYIVSLDREGNERRFPLLTVSAAVIHIPRGERNCSVDTIVSRITLLKKRAKGSPDHLAWADIQEDHAEKMVNSFSG